MAHHARRDQWSGHVFWVITEANAQEALLDNLSCLPYPTQIAFAVRPAPSYYIVLYHDGHIVEFAVFDMEHVAEGKLNQYRVLFDRGQVTTHLDNVYTNTR